VHYKTIMPSRSKKTKHLESLLPFYIPTPTMSETTPVLDYSTTPLPNYCIISWSSAKSVTLVPSCQLHTRLDPLLRIVHYYCTLLYVVSCDSGDAPVLPARSRGDENLPFHGGEHAQSLRTLLAAERVSAPQSISHAFSNFYSVHMCKYMQICGNVCTYRCSLYLGPSFVPSYLAP